MERGRQNARPTVPDREAASKRFAGGQRRLPRRANYEGPSRAAKRSLPRKGMTASFNESVSSGATPANRPVAVPRLPRFTEARGLLFWIDEGLIDSRAALVFDHGHAWSPEALDHGYKDDVIGGIDPEPGAGGAIPEESAATIGKIGELRIVFDGAVVSVAEAGPHDVNADAEFAREELRREMVAAHELHRRRRENTDAIQLPAVREHGGEAVVVFGG